MGEVPKGERGGPRRRSNNGSILFWKDGPVNSVQCGEERGTPGKSPTAREEVCQCKLWLHIRFEEWTDL